MSFSKVKTKLSQFFCIHQNIRKIGSDDNYDYVECTLCGKRDWVNKNSIIWTGKYIYTSPGGEHSRFQVNDKKMNEKPSFWTWLDRNLKKWVFTIKPVERIFGLIWAIASIIVIWSFNQLYIVLTLLGSLAIAYGLYRRGKSENKIQRC